MADEAGLPPQVQQEQQQAASQQVVGRTIKEGGYTYNTWEPTYSAIDNTGKTVQVGNPYYQPGTVAPAAVAAPAPTTQYSSYGYEILAPGATPQVGKEYALGTGSQLIRVNQYGSTELYNATSYNPNMAPPVAPGPTGLYLEYIGGKTPVISAIYTPGAVPFVGKYGGTLTTPTGEHVTVAQAVGLFEGYGGNSSAIGGKQAPKGDYVQGQQVNPSVGFLPGQNPAAAPNQDIAGTPVNGAGVPAYFTGSIYGIVKAPKEEPNMIYAGSSTSSYQYGQGLQTPNQISEGTAKPMNQYAQSGSENEILSLPELKSVNDLIFKSPEIVGLTLYGGTKAIASASSDFQKTVVEPPTNAAFEAASLSGTTDINVPVMAAKVVANIGIAAGYAVASVPAFVGSLPFGFEEAVREPSTAPRKAYKIGSATVSQTIEREKSNTGALLGTVLGNLAFGKGVNIAAAKGMGYYRTAGMEFVPVEDIGYAMESGYPKTTGAQSVADLKKSFQTGTLNPTPEFMQSAGGVRGESPVPFVHGEGGVKPARLPGAPVDDTMIAYTGHPADFWAGNTKVGGKTVLLEGGTSEQPGAYAAPVAETYFTKVPTQAETSLAGFGIPGITQKPVVYATEVPKVVGASAEARAAAPADMAATQAATGSSTYGWTSLTKDMIEKATASDKGIMYLPRMKGEFEGIIPVGTETEILGRNYYTVVGGQRVPIVQQRITGFKPQTEVAVAPDAATQPSTASGYGTYYYNAPQVAEINPLSGGAASTSYAASSNAGVGVGAPSASGYAPYSSGSAPTFTGFTPADYVSKPTPSDSSGVPSKYRSDITFSGYTPDYYTATPEEIAAARVEDASLKSDVSSISSESAQMMSSSILSGESALSSGTSSAQSSALPSAVSSGSFPSSTVMPYSASFALAGPPSIGVNSSGSSGTSSNMFGSYGGSYGGSSYGGSSGGSSSGGSSSGRSSSGGSSSGGRSYGGSSYGGSSSGGSSSGGRSFEPTIPEMKLPTFPSGSELTRKRKLPKRKGFGFLEVFSLDVRSTASRGFPGVSGLAGKSPHFEARVKAKDFLRQKKAVGISLSPGEARAIQTRNPLLSEPYTGSYKKKRGKKGNDNFPF